MKVLAENSSLPVLVEVYARSDVVASGKVLAGVEYMAENILQGGNLLIGKTGRYRLPVSGERKLVERLDRKISITEKFLVQVSISFISILIFQEVI